MINKDGKLRIVQWTAGNVAYESIRAVLNRPDMELVGLYTYSREKIGQDVGDLVDLGYRTGILATGDIEEILVLKPDCIVYNPLKFNADHMEHILRAGINIVTTTNNFITDRACTEEERQRLESAARDGKASLFGSGMHPGWFDGMLVGATGICREVNLVRGIESVNLGAFAGDANQDILGWGRPANDPGHKENIIAGMKVFEDAVGTIAHDFDLTLDDIRCDVEFAYATEDLDIPGRDVKKGTVAGLMVTWQGVVDDTVVVELISQWVLASEIDPPWEVEMAYLYEIVGTPNLKIRVDILPDADEAGVDELVKTGMIMSALPTINAIPGVVAARAGIITFKDLPPVASIIRPDREKVEKAQYVPRSSEDVFNTDAEASLNEKTNSQSAAPEVRGLRSHIAVFFDHLANRIRGNKEITLPVGVPGSFDGNWNIAIRTPGNLVQTRLIVEKSDTGYIGTQSGEGNEEPIVNVKVEGGTVSWSSRITKPMKLKVDFKGIIIGNQITGRVKAGIFGSFPFTGQKV